MGKSSNKVGVSDSNSIFSNLKFFKKYLEWSETQLGVALQSCEAVLCKLVRLDSVDSKLPCVASKLPWVGSSLHCVASQARTV